MSKKKNTSRENLFEVKYECWVIRINEHGERSFWRRCNGFPGCRNKSDIVEKCENRKDWVPIDENVKHDEKYRQKSLLG